MSPIAQLPFERDEFAARQQQLVGEIQRRGLRGALLFRQESMYYLTGYDTFGYVFFQCLYVHCDGSMTLLTRSPDLRQAQLTSMIDDIRIWGDKQGANPAVDLLSIVNDYGGDNKLGVEWDSYGLTAHNGRLLEAAFTDYQLNDFSDAVTTLRVVKSETELAYVRRSAELADDALEAGMRETKAGAYEGDILAAMQGAVFCGGGEYSGNEFILGSGERALLCRSFAGRRHLSATDQLTVEFAGSYYHYHAALMRTFVVGSPSPHQKNMHAVAVESFAATKAALHPGALVGTAFDAHAKVIDEAGFGAHRMNATGYSLGTTFAPSWMDKPMLYHGNTTVVETNMVFFVHIILMDSDTKTAMSTGETLLVTPSGAVGLSRHNHDLVCK